MVGSVGFSDSYRQAINDATAFAGLKPLRCIRNTSAAAFSFSLDTIYTEETNVFCLIMGGQSYSMTKLIIEDNIVENIPIKSNDQLGGINFTNKIVDFCIGEFRRKTGLDISRDQVVAVNKLREQCERAKIMLSRSLEVSVFCEKIVSGVDLCIQITREKFEQLSKPLLQEILEQL